MTANRRQSDFANLEYNGIGSLRGLEQRQTFPLLEGFCPSEANLRLPCGTTVALARYETQACPRLHMHGGHGARGEIARTAGLAMNSTESRSAGSLEFRLGKSCTSAGDSWVIHQYVESRQLVWASDWPASI